MLYNSLANVDFEDKKEMYKTNSSQEEFSVNINGKECSFKFLEQGDKEAEPGEIASAWEVNGKLVKYAQSIHLVGEQDYDEDANILYQDDVSEYCAYTILDNQIVVIDDFCLDPNSVNGLQPADYGAKDYSEITILSMPLNINNATKLLLFERQASREDGFDNYYRKSKVSQEDIDVLKDFANEKRKVLNESTINHDISEIEDVISDRRPEDINNVTEWTNQQVKTDERETEDQDVVLD